MPSRLALPALLSACALGACGHLPSMVADDGASGFARTRDEKADMRQQLANARFAQSVVTGGARRLLDALAEKKLAAARKHAMFLLLIAGQIDPESTQFDSRLTERVCEGAMVYACRNLVSAKKEIFALALELQKKPELIDQSAALALARRIQSVTILEGRRD